MVLDKSSGVQLFPQIVEFIETLRIYEIPANRLEMLEPMVVYAQDRVTRNLPVQLNFICTHNSRRSHLAQVWAQTLAAFYKIGNVLCYSGGTEATAMYPSVYKTLQETGFAVTPISEGNNPVMSLKCSEFHQPIICFSKKYDHPFNPQTAFAAIMTCTDADENCPLVLGSNSRISLPYEDPKAFDKTPEELLKYAERSLQIATELKYVFSKIVLPK